MHMLIIYTAIIKGRLKHSEDRILLLVQDPEINHIHVLIQELLVLIIRAQYNRSKVAGHCVRSETKMSDPCVQMSVH